MPHPSSWIRESTRLAIYIRDSLHCVYCLRSYKETALGIDHIKSRARGGDNRWTNLATCCPRCNGLLQDNVGGAGRVRLAVALGVSTQELQQRVRRAQKRGEAIAREKARRALQEKPEWFAELKIRATNTPKRGSDCEIVQRIQG